MATLTITVPDAVVPRIREAFGHLATPVRTSPWIPATVLEVQNAIKTFVKEKVVAYEGTTIKETSNVKFLTDIQTIRNESW